MSELKPCPFCGSDNVKMFYDERQNYHVECYGCNKTVSFHIVKESSWRKAVDIWNRRAQPGADTGNPVTGNDPLTLDELREMDGEPVWCVDAKGTGKWALVHAADDVCTDADFGDWEFYCYEWTDSDVGWLAYRRPPCEMRRTEKRS